MEKIEVVKFEKNTQSTNRRVRLNPDITSENVPENQCKLTPLKIILIVLGIAILIIGLTIGIIVASKKNNKNNENKIQIQTNPPSSEQKNDEEFKPLFSIKSVAGTGERYSYKTTSNHLTSSNGNTIKTLQNTQGILDVYINSETEQQKNSSYYNSIIKATVIIVNLTNCFDETKCIDTAGLDISSLKVYKNGHNQRQLENENSETIEHLLPIGVFEFTNNGILVSKSFQESLPESQKALITEFIQNVKPLSINGNSDENNTNSVTTQGNNKIITRKEKGEYYNEKEFFENSYFTSDFQLITNLEGQFISIQNVLNVSIGSEETALIRKDIESIISYDEEATKNLNMANYRNYLPLILKGLKFQKEEILNPDSLGKDEEEEEEEQQLPSKNRRHLYNKVKFETGLTTQNDVVNHPAYGKSFILQSSVDSGISIENSQSKISLNSQSSTLSSPADEAINIIDYTKRTTINEILQNLIALSQASNQLAQKLYDETAYSFSDMKEELGAKIKSINDILAYSDISSIFNSELAISGLISLPYSFVSASQKLNNGFCSINDEIDNGKLSVYKNQIKSTINNFLAKNHEYLRKIITNLNEFSSLMSSTISKIAEISSYYSNQTSTSYITAYEKTKAILSSYYINEKNIILPKVEELLTQFEANFTEKVERNKTSINNLMEKLENQETTINLASIEEIKQTITNLYNSIISVSSIIESSKNQLLKGIEYKSILNGEDCFETQTEINEDSASYAKLLSQVENITKKIDNDLLVDKTYDKVMSELKQQFTNVLKYISNEKQKRFPIEEDALSSYTSQYNFFNQSERAKIETEYSNAAIDIIDKVKNENNFFTDSLNSSINDFINQNKNQMEDIVSQLEALISPNKLSLINEKYNTTFNNALNSINIIVQNNINLAINYITAVKNINNAGHCIDYFTSSYINKYNIFLNQLTSNKNYISTQISIDSSNQYKNIINQITNLLNEIIRNSIFDLYSDKIPQLTFLKNHLKRIQELFNKLDTIFSDEIYNNKYLTKINDYKNKMKSLIDNGITSSKNLNSQMKGSKVNSEYDWFYKDCKKIKWYKSWHLHTTTKYYSYYSNVAETNNYQSLKSISFSSYNKDLIENFNALYNNFNKLSSNYISLLNKANSLIDTSKTNAINKKYCNDFLNTLTSITSNILSNKLGDNLFFSSYNKIKENLDNKIPPLLTDLIQYQQSYLNNTLNQVIENKEEFKSTPFELYFILMLQIQKYQQNTTYDIVDSLVEQKKAELNYTINKNYDIVFRFLNDTESFILSNIPENAFVFDYFLSLRKTEIINGFILLRNNIADSKSSYLDYNSQINKLKVSETNFYDANKYISDNLVTTTTEIVPIIAKVSMEVSQVNKASEVETVAAKMYVELSEFARQINTYYDNINSPYFIDLNIEQLKTLIQDNWILDQDNIIKNLSKFISDSTKQINQQFSSFEEETRNGIKNIIEKYFTKDSLNNKIKEFYDNGLKLPDNTYYNTILEKVTEVTNQFQTIAQNESSRLTNQLSTYHNNFDTIKNYIESFKQNSFSQINEAITKIKNDFISEIEAQIYTNYVLKYLDEYKYEVLKVIQNGQEDKLMNSTFNVSKVIETNINDVINEYLSYTQKLLIQFIEDYNTKFASFININNLKTFFDSQIDDTYNNILLPVLKEKATYNPTDQQAKAYDFSDEQKNNLNNLLATKNNEISSLLVKTKGEKYNFSFIYKIPDFSKIDRDLITEIKSKYNGFISSHKSNEEKDFYSNTLQVIKDNFNSLLNNLLPSFVSNFFERAFIYNKVNNLVPLFDNVVYSLKETVMLLIMIKNNYNFNTLPEDLKLKVYSLNNLEDIINNGNNNIMSQVNKVMNSFLDITSDYLVTNYISYLREDTSIDSAFNNNTRTIINLQLDAARNSLINQYNTIAKKYLTNPFISKYQQIVNEKSDYLILAINDFKLYLKKSLDDMFSSNSDNVISEINSKLNDIFTSIKEYNEHFNTFKLPESLYSNLNLFIDKSILPLYEETTSIVNTVTKDLIMQNLDKNILEFNSKYDDTALKKQSQTVAKDLNTSYFTHLTTALNNSVNDYESKVNEKIENLKIRRLTEEEGNIILDTQLNEKLSNINESMTLLGDTIKSLPQFDSFYKQISNNIIKIKNSAISAKYTVEQNNYDSVTKDELNSKIDILLNRALTYYNNVNLSFSEIELFIKNNFEIIKSLTNDYCNISINIIEKKYKETADETQKILEKNPLTISKEELPNFKFTLAGTTYEVKPTVKLETETNVELNFNFNNGPNVSLIVSNEIKKGEVVFDIVADLDTCIKRGNIITANLNSAKTDILVKYNNTNKVNYQKNSFVEEYNKIIQTYEINTVTNIISYERQCLPNTDICMDFPVYNLCGNKEISPDSNIQKVETKNDLETGFYY